MKEIIKGKKYKEIEDKVYVCETCGTEHENACEIEKCIVCDKDICSNCAEKQIAKFEGRLNFHKLIDGAKVNFCTMGEYANTIPVDVYRVHKECATKGMDPKKYMEELESIVNYFNNRIELLNSNSIKGNKTKEDDFRR